MKREKVFKYISNILFAVGGALALYAIITGFVLTSNLPEGVCPIDNSRPFLYVAIGLLAVSFITSFFTGKKKKSSGEDARQSDQAPEKEEKPDDDSGRV